MLETVTPKKQLSPSLPFPPRERKASFDLSDVMELVAPSLALLEKELASQSSSFHHDIAPYLAEACSSEGKRLRPLLVFLVAGMSGGIQEDHLKLALILEMIHIATLVHDDILDGAVIRRNRPTMVAEWGSKKSVLTGDILFAHALRLATEFEEKHLPRRIADATAAVCSGEILQMDRRFDLSLNQENYYHIIEMKTGSLFTIAAELSAFLNLGESSSVTILQEYGTIVGSVYQILDDCLDFLGRPDQIGKTLGTDLNSGKFTLPVLLLREELSEENQKVIDALLLKETKGEEGIATILRLMEESDIFSKTFEKAMCSLQRAEELLLNFSPSSYREGGVALVDYLKHRFESVLKKY